MRIHRYLLSLVVVGLSGATVALVHGQEVAESGSALVSPAGLSGDALQDAPAVKVRFDLYHGSLIVVRGSIGPLKNLNFLVDTGATPTVVDARIARKLHLDEVPVHIAVLGGSTQASEALLPDLDLGSLHVADLRILAEDLSFLDSAFPVHIDAMIGLDVLGRTSFVIDYAARQICFGPLPRLSVSVHIGKDAGLATVEAEVNHRPVRLLLDTGAGSLILFGTNAGLRPSGLDESEIKPRLIGEFRRNETWRWSVTLAGTEFAAEPVSVVQGRPQPGIHFDGLLNPAMLGISKIGIDLNAGVLAFNR